MRWTERQRAMLREMGLRPWFRDGDGDGDGAGVGLGVGDVDVSREAVAVAAAVAVANANATATATATARATMVAIETPKPGPSPATRSVPASPAVGSAAVVRRDPPTEAHRGLSQADWLIVGGPFEGADDGTRASVEAEQDKLLASMLRAIGVAGDAPDPASRSCRVGTGATGDDDPGLACDRVRPRIALALGRAAATALLDLDEPLGRLRGRVHAWRGMPVVVTFSLAYLLRNPGEKAKAWADLCLAVGTFDAAAAS